MRLMPEPLLDERGLPPGYPPLRAGWEVTPREARAALGAADVVLLDVRTPIERGQGMIEPSVFVPLQELPRRLGELESFKGKRLICYCKVGGRSLQAAQFLRQHGFADVTSMAGGITVWEADAQAKP